MFGKRLRLARKRAGLSMRSLAELMEPKVSAQAISKYESGIMLPSSAVLVALGKTLDVSLDFLMSAQVEALDGLEFRKHSGASARDRARAEAIIVDNLERYLIVEDILDIPSSYNWGEIQRCDSVIDYAQIEASADALRGDWKLGMEPIPSLCELLEDKGIKVIEDNFPESINGLSCHVLRGGKSVSEAVAVCNQISVERKRFTLAHELAHRIIRSTSSPAIKLEKAMNHFAGAFLIPSQHLIGAVGIHRNRITDYEFIRLKHAYGVSAAALLVRFGQVGILSQASIQHSFKTFARSWRKSEPEPIGINHGFGSFEKPRRFKRLVLRAVGEELISIVRAASLLNLSVDEVEQQIRGSSLP